jgi:hypothetical protein
VEGIYFSKNLFKKNEILQNRFLIKLQKSFYSNPHNNNNNNNMLIDSTKNTSVSIRTIINLPNVC